MRLKSLLVVLAAAGLGTSVAIAAPPPGKGKPPTAGIGCKPKVSVILKGTLAAAPGATGPLSVNVTRGNRPGQAWVSASQPVSIEVDTSTKVRRQGKTELADLMGGDRVVVQSRVCKADLGGATLPALTAVRVVAHPAQTTTTTTTTTSDT